MTDTGLLMGPDFFSDPYPSYSEMRDAARVHQLPIGPWLMLGFDDVNRVLRDPRTSVATDFDAQREHIEELIGRPMGERSPSMLGSDPPDHTRLRRLVQKAFTPRVIEQLRPLVQELVDEQLDRVVARDHAMDVIADIAFPLPFTVISRMLGMPPADADMLRDLSHTIVKTLDPIISDDEVRAAADANDRMDEHIDAAIAWKRKAPADDLLTGLIAAEDAGDMLTDGELRSQVALLFIAGHETTVNLIGNGLLALLRNRAAFEQLRNHPDLDVLAVDELLRYDSPVQFSARTVLQDFETSEGVVPAGSVALACLGSANRDPQRWGDHAESLDLTRVDAREAVSFGGGVHHCLGSALARLEGQVAIGALVRRFPQMELATDTPKWNGRMVLRGLDELPVTLG
jgi:cytochrome P450